jgi:hypothetical protein
MDLVFCNPSPKVEGCTNSDDGSDGDLAITFVVKEDHEEKWELGQHFLKVSDGKR